MAAHVLSGDAAAEVRVAHDGFLAAYRAGRWEDALSALTNLRQRNLPPLASLYGIYAKRIATLSAAQPSDWDGVYDLEEK